MLKFKQFFFPSTQVVREYETDIHLKDFESDVHVNYTDIYQKLKIIFELLNHKNST